MRRLASFVLALSLGCAPTSAASTAPVEAAPVATEPAAAAPVAAPAAGADPSVNESWKSDDIEPLVARLEGESREIYVHRELLATLVGPKPGATVADIGAGSGFMTLLFGEAVGKDGKVLAVDINPTMLERVAGLASEAGLQNVETMVSEQETTPLSPGTVDLVFICDTYHHFESPATTLASLLAALRPGGELVLVDFERIPGKTNEMMMKHVRAGKEVFRQEVLDAGFELITEHDVPELEDNYVLRFRKPG